MSFDSSNKPRLVELIKDLAIVHGKVTLSSGLEADYYVDLRRATLHHEASPLIGKVMLELLEANDFGNVDAVGGLTMGADPVATAILHQGAAQGKTLDAFVVRKQAKAHGMARQVEGPSVAGKQVVVLEDTSTTGGSPLTAAEALVAAGAEVVAVATVVDRDTGARQAIEAAGYPYLTAITLGDLGL
ncbi:MAG: orotate phosphoribosyltransferase [Micrococcales bacterium]|jgi:orotate phosphoribosyltransferase|nr:orotate phosphoribosyltransferase [Micrococcales bacterium]MDG2478625.1 orotate phosphoribosyltransferase [Aquiluna sp.]MBT5397861.1 orotate phosphoribosyltransferase [Micrococcales bacterium]MBT5431336.1 orotate phosphoribosyltransferase [Micrococcales bacterium]MBT5848250.1 orotate phosphoribosyltransferase [Micrococcales bacterium]